MAVLLLVCASILPLLTIVYQERTTIQEEARVLFKLEEVAQQYMSDSTEPAFIHSGVPVKKEEVKDGLMRFCSRWTGTNGRTYEHCLLAAR